MQRQAWRQQEQLQQWHGAAARQMAVEHAALLARASRYEAAAEAVVQRQQLDGRCVAAVIEQRGEQAVFTVRTEGAANLPEVGRLASELRSSSEKLQLAESELRSYSERLQVAESALRSSSEMLQLKEMKSTTFL